MIMKKYASLFRLIYAINCIITPCNMIIHRAEMKTFFLFQITFFCQLRIDRDTAFQHLMDRTVMRNHEEALTFFTRKVPKKRYFFFNLFLVSLNPFTVFTILLEVSLVSKPKLHLL